MVKLYVEAGICGFSALVKAEKIDKKHVRVQIKSDCEKVMCFANGVKRLNIIDLFRQPFNTSKVYEKAGQSHLHSSCVIPCAVFKAAEVELGLALKKDVRIVFQKG